MVALIGFGFTVTFAQSNKELLIRTLSDASNIESSDCYVLYNQSSNGHITGKIYYQNVCDEPIVVNVKYEVYDENWKYEYTETKTATLSETPSGSERQVTFFYTPSHMRLLNYWRVN